MLHSVTVGTESYTFGFSPQFNRRLQTFGIGGYAETTQLHLSANFGDEFDEYAHARGNQAAAGVDGCQF